MARQTPENVRLVTGDEVIDAIENDIANDPNATIDLFERMFSDWQTLKRDHSIV